MPLPALEKFERNIGRQLRVLELRKQLIERKIGRQIRLFEQTRDGRGEALLKSNEIFRGLGPPTSSHVDWLWLDDQACTFYFSPDTLN